MITLPQTILKGSEFGLTHSQSLSRKEWDCAPQTARDCFAVICVLLFRLYLIAYFMLIVNYLSLFYGHGALIVAEIIGKLPVIVCIDHD